MNEPIREDNTSPRDEGQYFYEHRLRAAIERDDGQVVELHSSWDDNYDEVAQSAFTLRKQGFAVSIESRDRHLTADLTEVPNEHAE